MITKMYIENFKGISNRIEIPIKPITLLFGPNSAGKSTILKANETFAKYFHSEKIGWDSRLFHNRDTDKEFLIGYQFDLTDLYFDDEVKIDTVENFNPEIKIERCNTDIWWIFENRITQDTLDEYARWLKKQEFDDDLGIVVTKKCHTAQNEGIKKSGCIFDRIGLYQTAASLSVLQALYIRESADQELHGEFKYRPECQTATIEYYFKGTKDSQVVLQKQRIIIDKHPLAELYPGNHVPNLRVNTDHPVFMGVICDKEINLLQWYYRFLADKTTGWIDYPVVLEGPYKDSRYWHDWDEDRYELNYDVDFSKTRMDSKRLIEYIENFQPINAFLDNGEINKLFKDSAPNFVTNIISFFIEKSQILFKRDYQIQIGNHRIGPVRKKQDLKQERSDEQREYDGQSEWSKVNEANIHIINEQLIKFGINYRIRLEKNIKKNTVGSEDYIDGEKVTPAISPIDKPDLVLFLDDVGEGITQILPVIIALTLRDEEGGLMIEQPELHIHPSLQVQLADMLIEYSAETKNTLLVETHSEHIMLRLLRRIRETTDKELKDDNLKLSKHDVSVNFVEKNKDNSVRVTHIRINDDGEFIDRWPRGFFEERADELF